MKEEKYIVQSYYKSTKNWANAGLLPYKSLESAKSAINRMLPFCSKDAKFRIIKRTITEEVVE